MKIKLNIWFLVLKQLFFSLVYWKTEHIGNEHTWQKNSDLWPLHQGQGLWLYIFVAQTVKRLPTMRETWVQSLGWEYPLEKEMATHSSGLAWKIPWTEEPGRLQSVGSQRVGHDWATSLSFFLSFQFLTKDQTEKIKDAAPLLVGPSPTSPQLPVQLEL